MTSKVKSKSRRPLPTSGPDSRRPLLREIASSRPIEGNPIMEVKTGSKRRRGQNGRAGITVSASFTICRQLDGLIHEMAIDQHVSRSAVIRQAVLHYALDRGYIEDS